VTRAARAIDTAFDTARSTPRDRHRVIGTA
jgi:hypothetical protein